MVAQIYTVQKNSLIQYLLVVGSFREIRTGYRGFETNEIRYFVCLLVYSKIIRMVYMRQNL